MALTQANLVASHLRAAWGLHDDAAAEGPEIIVIRTTGDRITDRPLADIGGKGLFAKELEEALFDGRIDVAVHSAKDLPSLLPDGLQIAATLPRADARDAFLSPKAATIGDLPRGSVIGTSSVRRQAQLLAKRPDLKIVMFRGNVDTRLAKLKAGEVDATILAAAGLERLGRLTEVQTVLSVDEMLPAAGQGIIALEIRADDERAAVAVSAIDHAQTSLALSLERAFLARLDGSCRTPLAAHARQDHDWSFRVLALAPDGSSQFSGGYDGAVLSATHASEIGEAAADDILSRAGRRLLLLE